MSTGFNYSKEIGHYNVSIYGGHLDQTNNRWYYRLQIDSFDDEDEWKDSNTFYIKGHEDKEAKEMHDYIMAIREWILNVTEKEIDNMLIYENNYIFKIKLPTKVKLI